ncbi:MAG: hypothetical protein ACE5G7_04925 [Candidatus Hydrothermarchaeaceae archaeon]
MASKINEDMAIAIASYKKHQWRELLRTADDREELEESYDEWLEGARRMEQLLRSMGKRVEWIEVDVPEFLRWCKERGMGNTASVRSFYAAELLRQKDQEA